MQRPPFLQPGDSVAVVATARKVDREAMEEGLRLLKSWDLKIVLGEHLFAEHHQFAGDDRARARDFQAALDIPEIKAIFCARGGYGSVRIMEYLDWSKFAEHPKWIVGMSDITVIHCQINGNLGVETIHGPMPGTFPTTGWDAMRNVKHALFGTLEKHIFEAHPLNQHGTATGTLIGGNLSILHSLTGTHLFPNTDNCILFIEDLDEYLYHLDRMIINLKLNDVFANLAGLIVGGMTKMHDNKVPFGKTYAEIILDHVIQHNYPVAFDFPAGHIQDNRSLFLGRNVSLTVGEENVLTFL